MSRVSEISLNKVPEVTLAFWVIKIAATTMGETAADVASMTMHLGYVIGTAIRDIRKRAHETTLFSASLRRGISMKFALESTMHFEISWDCGMQKTL